MVQYNRLDFNQASGGRPAALRRARRGQPLCALSRPPSPADRVTDENAPPRVLRADTPLLTPPNRIGDADWQGWVQERGLNFLDARDPRYEDILAFTDPFPLNPGRSAARWWTPRWAGAGGRTWAWGCSGSSGRRAGGLPAARQHRGPPPGR